MNGMKWCLTAIVMLAVCISSGWADDGWVKIATLTAGGDAKEVSVNKEISQCKIKCTTEPVIINTVVIREGGRKTPMTVATRFAKDQEHVLDLGGRKTVTGLRISDSNRGTYEVYVK